MNSTAHPRQSARRPRIEFETLAETTAVAIFLVQDHHIVYANPAATTITGYPPDELLGLELWQLAHPDYQAGLRKLGIAQAWVKDVPSRYELKIVTRGGEERWLDLTMSDVDYNNQTAVAVTAFDITERDRAERALRAAQRELEARVQARTAELAAANDRLNSVLSSITEAYLAFDADWRFLAVNPAAEQRIFDRPASELIGKIIWDEYPQTVGGEIHQQYRRAVESGLPAHFEALSRIVPGRWFEVHAYPHRGGLESYLRDITDRKQAETEIANLARFPDENPNPVLRLNQRGEVLYANAAGQTLLQTWARTTGDSTLAHWRTLGATTMASQVSRTVDVECDARVYSMFVTPIVEAGYVNLYGRDVTERQQAESQKEAALAALRLSEERFHVALQNAPITVATLDRDLRYTWVYNTRHGFKPEHVLGKRPDELIPPAEAAELMALLSQALETGLTARGEVSGHTGKVRWAYDVTAEPLRDAAGQVIGLTVANIDVAERRQREAELRQLNRTLRAHTHSDRALLRVATEAQFLEEVCRIVVEDCGHVMVWIGFAVDDEARTVRPVAHAGFESGYLEALQITWADTERGRGPTGTAIRTGQPSICRNMLTDPIFAPWREEALRRGYASSIVFPLLTDGRAFGAISIYSRDPDPFSDDEVKLLAALADDLAYGVQTIRLRATHVQAEEALRNAHAELERRVQDRTRQLAQANEELSREVLERERAESQLRLQITAVRAAANGIVITDRQGNIQWCNPAFTRMTGYEAEEALGQDFRLLNSGRQSAGFYRQLWDTILAGEVWQGELINRRKDGQVYVEEQTIAPVLDERGEITHFIAIKHDITERKQAEARLERYTQDLLAVSQAERAQRQLAETLSAASLALTQSLNLGSVLESLLDYVGRLVPYDSANVMLLETESRLIVRVTRGYERWNSQATVHAVTFDVQANRILEALLTTRQSCLIADTRTYPDWEVRPGIEHVRSWLGVPLIAGGHVIGLYSLDKAEPDYFTIEHQRMAELLVGQAAVAIQNAWLFEQVRAGHERLQSLSRRLVEAQEAERHYVARELHDEAGQALTSLLFGLRQLEPQLSDPAQAAQVAELKQITNGLFESLHRLAADLRPASLDHLGLVPVLQQYVKVMGERYGLIAQFKAVGFDNERLSVEIETALYRIVQEALTNIGRHARATRADVLLERRGDRVIVVVEDNGLGFDAEIGRFAQDGHLGLVGMQERVEMLGGSLTIESAAGAGATIVVEVPNDHSYSDC